MKWSHSPGSSGAGVIFKGILTLRRSSVLPVSPSLWQPISLLRWSRTLVFFIWLGYLVECFQFGFVLCFLIIRLGLWVGRRTERGTAFSSYPRGHMATACLVTGGADHVHLVKGASARFLHYTINVFLLLPLFLLLIFSSLFFLDCQLCCMCHVGSEAFDQSKTCSK